LAARKRHPHFHWLGGAAKLMSEQGFIDGHWTSPEGLTLHYRDYAGPAHRPPLLCIPGLTRNARDFELLAARFAGEWRMICVDLRGRGDSEHAKEAESYAPPTYLADLKVLFEELQLDRFVAVGTSLGGILTMLLAAIGEGDRIAGAVLNDIGPKVEQAGLERIGEYVGQGRSFPTWMHAARALREQQEKAFPDYDTSKWLRMAKQLMALSGNGRIVLDYDMSVGDAFGDPEQSAKVELWDAWRALSGRPLLVLRGELSDILSAETASKMGEEVPEAEIVTVPGVGHTPNFEEPAAQDAIARLLAKLA
jgi:pimeloyl-ACP methyl ester carboxylesterase